MIAAHQHPGCGRQQRRGRIEEVLLPYRPVVAVRAAGAAGLRVGTGRFAIVVVTDMDHQVRVARGGQTGHDGERPFHRVVAVLREGAFQAAAGVADHHDLLDLIWQGGNRQPIDGDRARRSGGVGDAHLHRIVAIRLAAGLARQRGAVADDFRAGHARGGDRAHVEPAVACQLHPWARQVGGAGCWGDKQGQNDEPTEQRQHAFPQPSSLRGAKPRGNPIELCARSAMEIASSLRS